jgi:hemerythrin-like domain-containing protein
MKATNLLIQEHKVILRALDVLDGMAASMEAEGRADPADVDKILDFLRWFADAHHQMKEETILFPVLKARAASEDRSVRHMIFEHDHERKLIEDLEKDLRLGEFSNFASGANRLSSTLRNHIYKEDQLLFPEADSLLDERQDNAIFELLNRFETALDKEILDVKLHDLRSLEWKYLRK